MSKCKIKTYGLAKGLNGEKEVIVA